MVHKRLELYLTVKLVLDFLNEHFGHGVMPHRYPERFQGDLIWPKNSTDLNPCHYVSRGYLKEIIHSNEPYNLVRHLSREPQGCSGTIIACTRSYLNRAVILHFVAYLLINILVMNRNYMLY